jgi:hypothetical protein
MQHAWADVLLHLFVAVTRLSADRACSILRMDRRSQSIVPCCRRVKLLFDVMSVLLGLGLVSVSAIVGRLSLHLDGRQPSKTRLVDLDMGRMVQYDTWSNSQWMTLRRKEGRLTDDPTSITKE